MQEENMEKRKKKIRINQDWYVPISLFGLGLVLYIAYGVKNSFQFLPLLEILGCWLASCVIPILNIKLQPRCPIYVNIWIAILIIIGGYLGGACAFYDQFQYWDTFCHTFFGMISGVVFIYLIHLFHIEKMNLFALAILELFFTLGLAGIWELFEFACDCMFHTDFQKIVLSVEQGKLPQWDTMMDMLVAFLGCLAHYIGYIIYRQIKAEKDRTKDSNVSII